MWSLWVPGVNPLSQGALYSLGPSNSAECLWQIPTDKLSNTQPPFQHEKGRSHSLLCSVTLCAKLFEEEHQGESVRGWEEFGGDKSSAFVTWIFWGCLQIFCNLPFLRWSENFLTNSHVLCVVANDAWEGKVEGVIFNDLCKNIWFLFFFFFFLK